MNGGDFIVTSSAPVEWGLNQTYWVSVLILLFLQRKSSIDELSDFGRRNSGSTRWMLVLRNSVLIARELAL